MIESTNDLLLRVIHDKKTYIEDNDLNRLFEELNQYHKQGNGLMVGKIINILYDCVNASLRHDIKKKISNIPDDINLFNLCYSYEQSLERDGRE